MKRSQRQKLNFYLVAAGFVLFTGLLIALFLPEITAWRWSIVDRLLVQVGQTRNDNEKSLYLQQANLIGYRDPVAIQANVEFWQERGELGQAIKTIENSVRSPNSVYLGNLALQAQGYNAALKYFQASTKEMASAQSLAGESLAYFNLGEIERGCDKAAAAAKLDLQSTNVKTLEQICSLLSKESTLTARELANIFWQARVYTKAEIQLQNIDNKSANEWLMLSRLASSRGELVVATERASQAYSVAPAKKEVLTTLIELYTLQHDKKNVAKYQALLQELDFTKYR